MTGTQMIMAAGGPYSSSVPPITGFTIGWSTGKDQFTVSNSPGTFPGNLTVNVTGGTPPYTYSILPYASTGMTITNAADPNTTVTYAGMTVTGQQDYLTFTASVTDSNAQSRGSSTDMDTRLTITMTRG